MSTFQKEITFLTKELDTTVTPNVWVNKEVTKTAVFKELDRQDKTQHKFHFKIISLFSTSEKDDEGKEKVNIDSDATYDMTVKGIKILLEIDQQFTAEDKAFFLQDSGAIFSFGMWFMMEKLYPFFFVLMKT